MWRGHYKQDRRKHCASPLLKSSVCDSQNKTSLYNAEISPPHAFLEMCDIRAGCLTIPCEKSAGTFVYHCRVMVDQNDYPLPLRLFSAERFEEEEENTAKKERKCRCAIESEDCVQLSGQSLGVGNSVFEGAPRRGCAMDNYI